MTKKKIRLKKYYEIAILSKDPDLEVFFFFYRADSLGLPGRAHQNDSPSTTVSLADLKGPESKRGRRLTQQLHVRLCEPWPFQQPKKRVTTPISD